MVAYNDYDALLETSTKSNRAFTEYVGRKEQQSVGSLLQKTWEWDAYHCIYDHISSLHGSSLVRALFVLDE